MLKQTDRKAVAGIIAEILMDKKYNNKDQTSNPRIGNFLVSSI